MTDAEAATPKQLAIEIAAADQQSLWHEGL